MKVCPQCHTKYTDDTLKFCLQDGKPLESFDDEKTIAFNQDSIANEDTIADNFSDGTQGFSGTTSSFESSKTNDDESSVGKKQYIPINSQEAETIPRPRNIVQDPPSRESFSHETKSGFGFLTGFLIAVLVIGLIGAGVLAVIFLPEMLRTNSNVSQNSNNTKPEVEKEKILSDTDKVKTSSSSTRKQDSGNFYDSKLAFDGNSRTAWCEGGKGPGKGEWIAFDFEKEVTLKKIIIEPGYFKTQELWSKNNRLKVANLKFSDGTTKSVTFPNEKKVQRINTENIKTKSVMITIRDVYPGSADAKDTLISEVKFIVE